jgi:hypothetical protein
VLRGHETLALVRYQHAYFALSKDLTTGNRHAPAPLVMLLISG